MAKSKQTIASARVANEPLPTVGARARAGFRHVRARLRGAGRAARGWPTVLVACAGFVLVCFALFRPSFVTFCRTKVSAAKISVDKYAYQAYAQYQTDSDEDCPDSIEALNKYIGRDSAKDPYGSPLIMLCGDDLPEEAKFAGIGILSAGKDKKRGTKDDVMSWKEARRE